MRSAGRQSVAGLQLSRQSRWRSTRDPPFDVGRARPPHDTQPMQDSINKSNGSSDNDNTHYVAAHLAGSVSGELALRGLLALLPTPTQNVDLPRVFPRAVRELIVHQVIWVNSVWSGRTYMITEGDFLSHLPFRKGKVVFANHAREFLIQCHLERKSAVVHRPPPCNVAAVSAWSVVFLSELLMKV